LNEIFDVSGQDLMSIEAKIRQTLSKSQNNSKRINMNFIDVSPYLNDRTKITAF